MIKMKSSVRSVDDNVTNFIDNEVKLNMNGVKRKARITCIDHNHDGKSLCLDHDFSIPSRTGCTLMLNGSRGFHEVFEINLNVTNSKGESISVGDWAMFHVAGHGSFRGQCVTMHDDFIASSRYIQVRKTDNNELVKIMSIVFPESDFELY